MIFCTPEQKPYKIRGGAKIITPSNARRRHRIGRGHLIFWQSIAPPVDGRPCNPRRPKQSLWIVQITLKGGHYVALQHGSMALKINAATANFRKFEIAFGSHPQKIPSQNPICESRQRKRTQKKMPPRPAKKTAAPWATRGRPFFALCLALHLFANRREPQNEMGLSF